MADGHERDTNARSSRRPALVAAPLAIAATASAVTLGIILQGSSTPGAAPAQVAPAAQSVPQSVAESEMLPYEDPTAPVDDPTASGEPRTSAPAGGDVAQRAPILSRSAARKLGPVQTVKAPNLMSRLATRQAVRAAKKDNTRLFVTDDLNLWTSPRKSAEQVGELDAGRKILVTGRHKWGRVEILVAGKPQWVTDGYLSADKPIGLGAGLSDEPCAEGSSIEGGLQSDAILVLRSVCNAFPQITTYGGYDNHGEHVTGKAIDIMTSDVEVGTAIAEFLRAHAAELNLYNVIWRQRIFTQERTGEGWRGMSSRGSATANHYDHVHVSTY